jgi:hypothetical protein
MGSMGAGSTTMTTASVPLREPISR